MGLEKLSLGGHKAVVIYHLSYKPPCNTILFLHDTKNLLMSRMYSPNIEASSWALYKNSTQWTQAGNWCGSFQWGKSIPNRVAVTQMTHTGY